MPNEKKRLRLFVLGKDDPNPNNWVHDWPRYEIVLAHSLDEALADSMLGFGTEIDLNTLEIEGSVQLAYFDKEEYPEDY